MRHLKGKNLYIYLRSVLLVFVAIYFFVAPAGVLIYDLRDPGLYNGKIPAFTYRIHGRLSENLVSWANERVASKKASTLDVHNISGTEWPMFSAVFYLWATEALQKSWENNPAVTPLMPRVYAKPAIEASAKLISDPDNAAWVKKHWGDNYLHRENLFYRMLLISGLTSYQKLTGDIQYQPLLRDQVDTLSKEIDDSPYGLLDDYPGECYPVDVLPAIAAIQRADEVLGSDHSKFVARSLRAFEGSRLDKNTDLPAYVASSKTGQGYGSARGVGISYMLIWAPELWPDTARSWYKQYEKEFWNEGTLISGFSEFPKGIAVGGLFFDVDSGPVISGYGVAASAFGIGAARANNKVGQAYPLMAEALVASWPLPNGTLLIPRLLSNLSDAPYLGEAALLFTMTRESRFELIPAKHVPLPPFVYLFWLFYAVFGVAILFSSVRTVLRLHRLSEEER